MTVIRIGAKPEPLEVTGLYYDGDRAVGRMAHLSIDETRSALTIEPDRNDTLHWPLSQIRIVPDQAGSDQLVLRLYDDPTARLILQDRLILARLPNANRPAPVTRRGRLLGWAIAAVASVALIIGVLVPTMADQLADYIPPEGERALGETTFQQIRSALDETGLGNPVPLCTGQDGQAALGLMQERLEAALPEAMPLTVHVLDHPMMNAFALPGGYIVFFRGLIEAAESPEEVAAVFAHEIGHVVSRDPTRHALRSAGSIGVLGLILGDFAGGAAVLFLAERLIQASYSREAEAGADAFARDVLLRADIDPTSLGTFFQRLYEKHGESDGFFAHFASHPALTDRILASDVPLPEGFGARPVLSEDNWRALKEICAR